LATLYAIAVMAACFALLVATVGSVASVLKPAPYGLPRSFVRQEPALTPVPVLEQRVEPLPFVGSERRRARMAAVAQRKRA
jgi:hypothetical protein